MKLILSCCPLFGMCDSEQLADSRAVKVGAKTKELACLSFVLIVPSSTSLSLIFPEKNPQKIKKTVFDSAPANTQPQTFPWRRRGRQPTPPTHTHTHTHTEEVNPREEAHFCCAAQFSFLFCVREDRSICIREEKRPAPKKLSQGTHTHTHTQWKSFP